MNKIGMRARLAVLATLTATAAGLLAGPASATTAAPDRSVAATVSRQVAIPNASVSFAITNARCFAGAITFTAKQQENGVSGVQQFRQKAREQEFTNAGWVNITNTLVSRSTRFPNDGRNFSFTLNWRFVHPANGASHRVIWQGFYLNGGGGVLFKTVPVRINCL
jgi:hypothetical protein